MATIPCLLCGRQLEERTSKNKKPYFVCDPCGVQTFIRGQSGIEKLREFQKNIAQRELRFRVHADSLHEIQAIIVEIEGLKTEIKRLESGSGLFFADEHKLRAKKSLIQRLNNLLAQLDAISTGKTRKN